MKTIRIVAAVIDTRHLTLYKEDGKTVTIPQGDPRLRQILESATPQLQANEQADGSSWADVDIREHNINSYADFQEQSLGVRFFRVAKAKLKKLLDLENQPVTPQVLGQLPVVPPSLAVPAAPATPVGVTPAPVEEEDDVHDVVLGDERMDGLDKSDDAAYAAFDAAVLEGKDDQAETFEPVVQVPETKVEQTMSVVDEIIAHAVSVTSEDFTEMGIVKQRPMAVGGITSNDHPDDKAEDTIVAVVDGKIIPGMELIKSQFGRAAHMGSTKGVERFLQRLASVIEHRSHSVEDLLRFMERADLPIADDGTIVIYKILRHQGKVYVDCHTRRVEQWVGAYVCMDTSLVDHNRNNECSNGLHVARRGYLNNFSGDVCVLAKLAPEDVIAVPSYDANKMRVCGYHILHELPDDLFNLLKQNKPITMNDSGKALLASVVAGKHTRKTHEVRITGSKGTGVVVKEIPVHVEPEPIMTPDAPDVVEALSDIHEEIDTPIEPTQVAEVAAASMTRKEQANELYDDWDIAKGGNGEAEALAKLLAFKKAAKVGWDRLGIPDPTKPAVAPAAKSAFDDKTTKVGKATPAKKILPTASEGSPRERITKLMGIGLDSPGVAQKIYDIKKASKKSWDVLGLTEAESNKVLKAVGKVP